jgi:hypothetical protein
VVGNKYSPLRNGTGTIGDNPPAVVQLQMHLIEIEYWVENQYDDSNDPTNVYTSTSSTTALPPNPTAISPGETAIAKAIAGLSPGQ